MSEQYLYSALPAGKLFRPKLAIACFEDHWGDSTSKLKDPTQPLSLLCSALEIHHAYTLVHDDLPCMDDDDFRRGKESTHKKFGEWQALLAGDGMMGISFQLIQPLNFETRRFFSWATGPRGLIFGQYMDLSQDAAQSFQNMLLIHQLKTARLIQTALVGGYLVNLDKMTKTEFKKAKELFRLGHALGLSFQLIDDLTELGDEKVGTHEMNINPWIHQKEQTITVLNKQLKIIKSRHQNSCLSREIELYLNKMSQKIKSSKRIIEGHLKSELPSLNL